MRLDKFLKVTRVIKRRSVAKDACDAGVIRVNGLKAKASKKLKEGDIVEIETPVYYLKFEVLKIPHGNVRKGETVNLVRIIEEKRRKWEDLE